jgi:hypothetical protein
LYKEQQRRDLIRNLPEERKDRLSKYVWCHNYGDVSYYSGAAYVDEDYHLDALYRAHDTEGIDKRYWAIFSYDDEYSSQYDIHCFNELPELQQWMNDTRDLDLSCVIDTESWKVTTPVNIDVQITLTWGDENESRT